MYTISRIYVGNYGWNSAWYDGVLFDLRDRLTGSPTDAIITLENGGGKTTLLSGIFSVFEARKDRFLKTLHDSNSRFANYFSPDGLPGFILVEWFRTDPITKHYTTIVTGQCVTIKSAIDRQETDRIFFSFEARSGLALEDVPAPKLHPGQAARNLQDIQTWLHHMRTTHRGNFFETKNLTDWGQHLASERGIDVDMLRLQVDFSRQEGGIDSAFLTFRTEQDFLRKFFQLTMDAARANQVRDSVAAACDKLERKPEYEDRLAALTSVQTKMVGFAKEAQELVATKAELSALRADLRITYFTALRLEENSMAQHAEQDALAKQKADEIVELNQASATCRSRWTALQALVLQRKFDECSRNKQIADEEVQDLKLKLKLLDTAKAKSEVDQIKEEISRIDKLCESARKGLEPFEREAKTRGTLLRFALAKLQSQLTCDAKEAEATAQREESAAIAKQKQLDSVAKELKGQVVTLSKLRTEEELFDKERNKLFARQLLKELDEPIENAISRIKTLIDLDRDTEQKLSLTIDSLTEDAGNKSAELVEARQSEARVTQKICEMEGLLADCATAREELSHNSWLCRASDADLCDPDQPDLIEHVERDIRRIEGNIQKISIEISEVEREELSIARTRLAGSSKDVEVILEQLTALGITTACAFNEYLANIEPNAERAGKILASNPAKYLGIAIQNPAELAQAKALLALPPKLLRPVCISLSSDTEGKIDDGFVVPAADNSLCNFDEANELARKLASTRGELELERRQLRNNNKEQIEALHRLKNYVTTYGAEVVSKLRGALAEHKDEIARLAGRSEKLCAEITGIQLELESARTDLVSTGRRITANEGHNQTLESFVEQFGNANDRRQRIASTEADVYRLEESHESLKSEITAHNQHVTSQKVLEQQLRNAINNVSDEINGIVLVDTSLDAEQHLRLEPTSVDALRDTYQQAVSIFNLQESIRIGALKERKNSKEAEQIKKQNEYVRLAAKLDAAAIEQFKGCNFESTKLQIESRLEAANSTAAFALAARATAKQIHDSFLAEHDGVKDVSADFASIATEEILPKIEEFKDQETKSKQLATEAEHASFQAKEAAKDAKTKARFASSVCKQLVDLVANELPCQPNTQLMEDAEHLMEVGSGLAAKHRELQNALMRCQSRAQDKLNDLKSEATGKLSSLEPSIAHDLTRNELHATCENSERLLKLLDDRINTLNDNLAALRADFDAAVDELHQLLQEGISLLTRATKKSVPDKVAFVGGKSVLRMNAAFASIPADTRRQAISDLMNDTIRSRLIHRCGTDLVADALLRVSGKPLGLKFLKMTVDPSEQYCSVDKISVSGGEGVVMAMFLYAVLAQLRAEMQADTRKAGGGPLILDNPFAKATTPALWIAQRAVAKAMGIQLIFATALSDYNTLGEFERIFRLRKSAQNTKTNRFHIELVDYQLIKNG